MPHTLASITDESPESSFVQATLSSLLPTTVVKKSKVKTKFKHAFGQIFAKLSAIHPLLNSNSQNFQTHVYVKNGSAEFFDQLENSPDIGSRVVFNLVDLHGFGPSSMKSKLHDMKEAGGPRTMTMTRAATKWKAKEAPSRSPLALQGRELLALRKEC